MKKVIALLLSLTLLLSCSVVFAENAAEKEHLGTININGEFNLKCTLPEGYRVIVADAQSAHLLATIMSDDPEKPILILSVAYDDSYANVARMNDLTEEELAFIEGTFQDDYNVEITYAETAYGTKLLIAKEVGEKEDFVDIMSVYDGYFIEFVMAPGFEATEKTLTEEQIQMCINFLSELDFEPVA